MDHSISVIVVEDHEILRNRYIELLKYEPGIDLLGWASNSSDAVDIVLEKKPDVVLMDIEMETSDAGIVASREIMSKLPDTKIIILTVHDDDNSIAKAFQAGAVNYVLKSASLVEILNAIKNAYNNITSLSPCISNKVINELRKMKTAQDSLLMILNVISQLTKTEVTVMILLYRGHTQREICKIRNIELSTVKTHVKNILRKFGKSRMKEVIEIIDNFGIAPYLETLID